MSFWQLRHQSITTMLAPSWFDDGGEAEVMRTEHQNGKVLNHDFSLKSKKQAFGSGSLTSEAKLHRNRKLIFSFRDIDASSDNSYETQYKIHAQQSSCLASAVPLKSLPDLDIILKATRAWALGISGQTELQTPHRNPLIHHPTPLYRR